jgi:RHS repeat-associated protein
MRSINLTANIQTALGTAGGRKLLRGLLVNLALLLFLAPAVPAQNTQHTENKADLVLRGSGRVNPSSLGMEFDLPLNSYTGRGISVPVGLSYSSKLWRLDYSHSEPIPNNPKCRSVNRARYSESAAAGWTTTLAVPYVEYTGEGSLFDERGFPVVEVPCPSSPPGPSFHGYVKRLTVHLPGGATHELRADDTPVMYPQSQLIPFDWDATFYAVDGSNVRYVENSATNTYRLLLPDGTFYDFAQAREPFVVDSPPVRKAERFTDRNGNQTTYHPPGSVDSDGVAHPHGYWKDTLGRNIAVPFKPEVPAAPSVQDYRLPGQTGVYRFHWKRLKGNTPEESGLTDFGQQLKTIPALFPGDLENVVVDPGGGPFNPIVLTAIELPTGQIYRFGYNVYGEIERLAFPTGGEERFTYGVVPPLGDTGNSSSSNHVHWRINRGVATRTVFEAAGAGESLRWTYAAMKVGNYGYMVTVTAPDLTYTQRLLHRGYDNCTGCQPVLGNWGYDNGLSGRAYEERSFSAQGQPLTRKLTHWAKTSFPNAGYRTKDWHPRVTQEESIVYDAGGNAVSATTRFQYEGDLGLRETPVLVKRSTQYAFVAMPGANSLLPDGPPDPDPTPVPTPIPPQPLKTVENTFLINDPNVPQAVRDAYRSLNLVGLTTVTTVTDGASALVSRTETRYDEPGLSPEYRGNPTTSRVWDSGKGAETDADAYISTHARFDAHGNRVATVDALGNTTTTEYDATHNAFPVRVRLPAPDPNPSGNPDQLPHGAQTEFVTESTFDPVTGLPLTTREPNGLETRIEYDPATLRMTKVSNYYEGRLLRDVSESFYHDEPNNSWRKTRVQLDENSYSEAITYFDGLGRAYKSEEVDARGSVFVEKRFDAEGRVKEVTNPFRSGEARQWTTNVYDHASRVVEVVMPDGSKVRTDYGVSVAGAVGVTKIITDQAGRKRQGISDALGRMIRVIEDPGGQNLVTDYFFDTLGNLRRTAQGGQSRYFAYDSLGRLLRARQPEQEANPNLALPQPDPATGNNEWSVRYEYDDNGNTVAVTDARNIRSTASYDRINRLIHRGYSDATPAVGFFYDGAGLQTAPDFSLGRRTKVSSSVSETRYTGFDVLGRLLTSQQLTTPQQRAGTQAPYTSTYAYNLAGAVVSETYPSGRVVASRYDENGKLESVSGQKPGQPSPKLYLDQLSYTAAGAVERMRLGNGRWETAQYNERLQVTRIGLGHSAGDRSLLRLDYGYGTASQNNGALREQRLGFTGLGGQIVQTYAYDNLNRLQSSTETHGGTQSWKQTFSYDIYGNRRFDAAGTTTLDPNDAPKISNPLINTSDNRLTRHQDGDAFADYDYDQAGNLTLDAENRRFVYNAENRQTAFFSPFNNSRNPDATYHYDGEGRRVRKVIGGNIETVFVYNGGGQLVAEYSDRQPAKARVSYLTSDHLGSPRVVTDELGRVVSRHDYMAFGDEVAAGAANRSAAQGYGVGNEIRKQYTGYERDEESGLDYAQARYYNPAHGRFTSVDPLTASASIRNPQTFNRYAYALNSPYKFTDPLGLIYETATSCCSRAAIERQIREDFAGIEMPDGNIYYPDEKSLQKIVEKLFPFYDKAAKAGRAAQQALNLAAQRAPRIVGTVETEVVEPGKSTTTTVTTNLGISGGASARAGAKARSSQSTEKIEGEEEWEGSTDDHVDGNLSGSVTTVVTETAPTTKTKTTTVPDPSIHKAQDKLESALAEIPNLAEAAANSLVDMSVNGIVMNPRTDTIVPGEKGVMRTITPKLNGFDLENKLQNMFDAGRDSRRPKQ